MYLAETLFGAAGILLFAVMAFYTLEILRNIWKHEKFSMSQFFLSEKGVSAFKVLVVSAMIFSVGMIGAAVALVVDIALLEDVSKIGSVILFMGYVYFLRTVSHLTAKKSQE